MFKRRIEPVDTVAVTCDGAPHRVPVGETVAAFLLSLADGPTRETPVNGSKRAPYCMMGVCFDCLVEIDGIANRQACMTVVRDGMRIRRQTGDNVFGGQP